MRIRYTTYMLILGSSFASFKILSLRSGTPVGTVIGHLINPHKLRIDGLWCKASVSKKPLLLLAQDIREISPSGIVVDDEDVMVDPSEVIRLKTIIDLHFELLEKKTLSGRLPLGKVADYAVDSDTLFVQKLYISPAIWKKIKTERLTIDRSQIIEVSHSYVRVSGGEQKSSPRLRSKTQRSLSPTPSLSASDTAE